MGEGRTLGLKGTGNLIHVEYWFQNALIIGRIAHKHPNISVSCPFLNQRYNTSCHFLHFGIAVDGGKKMNGRAIFIIDLPGRKIFRYKPQGRMYLHGKSRGDIFYRYVGFACQFGYRIHGTV